MKNAIGILKMITLNLYIALGSMDFLIIFIFFQYMSTNILSFVFVYSISFIYIL